jgi:hypothetical protein
MPSPIRPLVTTATPQCYAHINAKVNAHNTSSPKPVQPHASAYATKAAIADEVRRQQNREMRRKLAKVEAKVDSCNKTLLKRQSRSRREDTPSQMPSEHRNAQSSARQRLAAVTATTKAQVKVSKPTRLSRATPDSVSRPTGRTSKALREYAMPRNPVQSVTDSHDGSLFSTGSDSDSDTSSTSNSMMSPRDAHTIQTPNAKRQTTVQPSADSQNCQMALQTPPDQDHSIEMTNPLRRRIQPMKPKETPSFWDCWDGF